MRTAYFRAGSLVGSVILGLIVACSGNDGANGANGTNGANGGQGTAGAAGPAGISGASGTNGTNGGGGGDAGQLYLALSERATQGLKIAPVPLKLAGLTASQIEQVGIGSYMANGMTACTDCHSPSPDPAHYLAGGFVFPLGPGLQVVSRNLTPDPTTGLKDTLDQFIQAERNGTDILNVGQALLGHPWAHHRWLSTDDLTAVYSYLKVIPPVSNSVASDNKPPTTAITFPGHYNEGAVDRPLPPEIGAFGAPNPDPDNILRGLAIVPLDIPFPADPATLAQFGRGSYIVNAGGACNECHTNPDRDHLSANLAVNTKMYLGGGAVFPFPPALAAQAGVTRVMTANLLGQTRGFFNRPNISFQMFLTAITEGVHAEELQADGGGARPLAFPMPWLDFRNLTRSDLEAIYTYMSYIAKTQPTTGAGDKVVQAYAVYCDATVACRGPNETCNVATNECVGKVCATNADCYTCQTCDGTNHCIAPAPTSTCLTLGDTPP
jgi:hypothetical protein